MNSLEPMSTPELTLELEAFLHCPTPAPWLDWALQNQTLMLIDHANCEKKAASNAMGLMYRHVAHTDLLTKMSQLAREELLHFEQVVTLMAERGITYERIGPSRYAAGLRDHMRTDKREQALTDSLIVGAIVEARSCERFARLAPLLDAKLGKFYLSLLRSEARHYRDYLTLAAQYTGEDINPRVQHFLAVEKWLIESEDEEFRFHSGVPRKI
ncbi:MAG: tRNA-(ms[2]io[6]A)-hydroxylase [Pseudohongiella sp.]|uniref:tRNA-(ms[2]io[6]A)-hydroxylase n=1 Tax=Pseudohongiella sp. TaxID=1979412 RepID=UPI00349FD441